MLEEMILVDYVMENVLGVYFLGLCFDGIFFFVSMFLFCVFGVSFFVFFFLDVSVCK